MPGSATKAQSPTQASLSSKKVIPSTSRGWLVAVSQFMLAAVSLGIVVLAGAWAWHYRHVQSQVAWLERHQATYQWHYQVPNFDQLAWQSMQWKLAPVFGPALISNIHTVTMDKPTLTEQDWSALSRLSHLTKLTLASEQATDETLTHIARLKELRSLTISSRHITFEGLLELRKLPRLRYLKLSDMRLSMAELAVLESAVPQANLKYNNTDVQRSYERRVVGRYPRVEPRSAIAEVGFAPMLKMEKSM